MIWQNLFENISFQRPQQHNEVLLIFRVDCVKAIQTHKESNFLPVAGVSSSSSSKTLPVRNEPGKYSKLSSSRRIRNFFNFLAISNGYEGYWR